MKKLAIIAVFLFLGRAFLFSEVTKFEDVKIRRHKSADKRELVDKTGVLSFDDDAKKLTFQSGAGDNFAVLYADVTKVVFDSDTHMNGEDAKFIAVGAIAGTIAGSFVDRAHVHDRWLYLEYSHEGNAEKVLLVLPGKTYDEATAKSRSIFGERMTIASYPEKGEAIADKDGLIDIGRVPDLPSKHSLKLDRTNHPLPEVKPDKATIVVVCPPLAARYTGLGGQLKLHANDKVVAVNKMGSYSFAYVDPGKYSLISQGKNANGFAMDLEAGKTYYFIQETFQGDETALSRNSPEVVMYLVDGTYFADWKRLN
jgi:hypothetical protein